VAIKLFNLRNVPGDEAEDIRQLLHEQNIEFHETTAGVWSTGVPAIWLNDDRHLEQARTSIDAYQKQRTEMARTAYAEQKESGNARTVLHLIRENLARFFLFLAAALFILYVSLTPFLNFLEN